MMTKSILVIEDQSAIAEMLSMLLADEGYTVRVARTAQDGLAQARAERPDLVTLDLALPGESGATLLRALSVDGAPPVLVISAHPEELAPAEAALASAILRKPFDIDDVLACVTRLLG